VSRVGCSTIRARGPYLLVARVWSALPFVLFILLGRGGFGSRGTLVAIFAALAVQVLLLAPMISVSADQVVIRSLSGRRVFARTEVAPLIVPGRVMWYPSYELRLLTPEGPIDFRWISWYRPDRLWGADWASASRQRVLQILERPAD
jgi:hypothetical protein